MTDNDNKSDPPPTNLVDFRARRAKTPEPNKAVPDSNKTKLLVFGAFITESLTMIEVVTSFPGVMLPPDSFRKSAELLNFSRTFGLADFVFDERGVRATLSFKGQNHFVDAPWEAVFRMTKMTTRETLVWPYDAPALEAGPMEQAEEPPPQN